MSNLSVGLMCNVQAESDPGRGLWNMCWLKLMVLFICLISLKSIDLVCMKKLDTKVNIIPIIAKADTISKTELQKFKVSVRN
jgi:hypothetical protein